MNNASAQSYKKIHNQAIVIDAHNDILSSGQDSAYSIDQNLTEKTNIDLNRMKQGGLDVQDFSICCDSDRKHPYNYAIQLLGGKLLQSGIVKSIVQNDCE